MAIASTINKWSVFVECPGLAAATIRQKNYASGADQAYDLSSEETPFGLTKEERQHAPLRHRKQRVGEACRPQRRLVSHGGTRSRRPGWPRIPILRISIPVSGTLQSPFCIHCMLAGQPAATLDRCRPAAIKDAGCRNRAHDVY